MSGLAALDALPKDKQREVIEFELARRYLLAFTHYTKDDYEINWHHKIVAKKLDEVLAGTCRRLMIFMPPQNGKSELVSRRLPAYALGRNPNLRIIACSYSDSLAQDMSRDVQKIMSTPTYARLFSGTRLAGSKDAEKRTQGQFDVVGGSGYYIATGIRGSITGKTSDLGIVDDPIKDSLEAGSETFRNRVWEQYQSTFATRQFGESGAIVLCMTRWHEDDLAGRLLKMAADNPVADQWDVVSLPALAEADDEHRKTGEPLWPSKYPLMDLTRRRVGMGEYVWASLYQQRPAPLSGGMIQFDWISDGRNGTQDHRWHRPCGLDCNRCLPHHFDDMIQSWDCAFKAGAQNSYVVGQVWARKGATVYLLDQVRDHLDLPGTLQAVVSLSARWPATTTKLVEDKANGPAVLQMLQNSVPGMIAVKADISKEARLSAVSPFFEAGNVLLPADAPWLDGYVLELTTFPNARHDDQVDATSQAVWRLLGETALTRHVSLQDSDVGLFATTVDTVGAFDEIYGNWEATIGMP